MDIRESFILQFQMVITVCNMRGCGQGYVALGKLTALVSLPKSTTANSYDKIVNCLNLVAKEVANETIRDCLKDLRSKSKDPNNDTVIDTALSCECNWQKRGYSMLLRSYLWIMVKPLTLNQ